jgi:hypothetical protein
MDLPPAKMLSMTCNTGYQKVAIIVRKLTFTSGFAAVSLCAHFRHLDFLILAFALFSNSL